MWILNQEQRNIFLWMTSNLSVTVIEAHIKIITFSFSSRSTVTWRPVTLEASFHQHSSAASLQCNLFKCELCKNGLYSSTLMADLWLLLYDWCWSIPGTPVVNWDFYTSSNPADGSACSAQPCPDYICNLHILLKFLTSHTARPLWLSIEGN